MRIDLMIEGQEDVDWTQWVALARACEDHGLNGLFRSDHYLSVAGVEERGSLDAWATLAGLAAVTSRIRLGTMVSPATFRHPSEVAKVAATVDHISGGRVELGLGAGWLEREHRAYGFEFRPMPERMAVFAEQLEIVHRQWTEDSFDFAGEHYQLERCRALPRPLQTPHPPLIVGGAAKRGTVEPAVRFADEYNTVYADPGECRKRKARVDAACERHGRDPSTMVFSVMTGVVLGSDRADLLARIRRLMDWRGATGDEKAYIDELGPAWIVGTIEEATERLGALEEAGVERLYAQHLHHAETEAVALIGELVQ